ncbi:MAG TPA: hypothetical protein VN868_02340, partial [Terriglobales bacterium]|nr:hypothetical protein [Terriglobales bacterium]
PFVLQNLRRRYFLYVGIIFLVFLGERHMLFAWISLITVGLTDLYVRPVASGALLDLSSAMALRQSPVPSLPDDLKQLTEEK